MRTALVLVCLISSACAAITAKKQTAVLAQSLDQADYDVYVQGRRWGRTGDIIRLSNSRSVIVELKDENRTVEVCSVSSAAQGEFIILDALWLLGGIVPGAIALAVDAGTQSWNGLDVDGCPFLLIQ